MKERGRDDGSGVVQGVNFGRGGEVIDFDGVVGAAADGGEAGNGDGFDGRDVGGEGEEGD